LKITIFGLTISSSWGNGHATPYRALIRALGRSGHRITFFERDVSYYASHRDFNRCEYCDLRLYRCWEDIRNVALDCAASSDAVICASYCPDGARIADEILDLGGPVRLFYDLDTPITLGNLLRGDLDYLRREQIRFFDCYLSFTGGRILEELVSDWGARSAFPLYGCVDPDLHRSVPARKDYLCDLSYMGTFASDRQQTLEALFLEPARHMPESCFLLAGPLYPPEMQFPRNVRRMYHVPPEEHSVFYSSARATLNITRGDMARFGFCPSGRFFEAAACGAPIITDWFDGLDTFFKISGEDAEVLQISTTEDTRSVLQLPQRDLLRMAQRARERTLAEHTGQQRASQLLHYIEVARSCSRMEAPESTAMRGEAA
jgi:spore maturation protein CgeB